MKFRRGAVLELILVRGRGVGRLHITKVKGLIGGGGGYRGSVVDSLRRGGGNDKIGSTAFACAG